MQDRVFEETGDYSMSLTNQFIGTDVILNDSSISGYENMGFNVKSMTQDVYQGQFTITTDDPIPLMPYGDRYTWAKYGHFIIHNGIIPADNSSVGSDDESPENPDKHSMADNMNSRLTVNHRDCLISFLRTDPDDAASFIVDASSTCLIDEFVNKIFRSLTKRTEKGYFFDAFIEQNADFTVSSICVIVKEATKIPLSIFTDLFHNRFKKKNYLGSTLELLQQFYIKLADHSKTFKIWVGDLHKYCLHCTRCHCAITIPDYIECIMEMAPIAMLWHMGMASDVNDYHHCPLILPN